MDADVLVSSDALYFGPVVINFESWTLATILWCYVLLTFFWRYFH